MRPRLGAHRIPQTVWKDVFPARAKLSVAPLKMEKVRRYPEGELKLQGNAQAEDRRELKVTGRAL